MVFLSNRRARKGLDKEMPIHFDWEVGNEPWTWGANRNVKNIMSPNRTPPSITDPNRRLVYFATRGDLNEVRNLINEHRADVHCGLDLPLHGAAINGRMETVRALVQEFGADVLADHASAYHGAIRYGHKEIPDYLQVSAKITK